MFIHATNESSSKKIINSQHIRPSKADVYELFDQYIDRIDNILASKDGQHLLKDFNLSIRPHYCYLGKGVYCFHKKDLAIAKEYDPNKKKLIEITLNQNSEKILDLNDKNNFEKLINDIKLNFPTSKDYELHFSLFKNALILNLMYLKIHNHDSVPFSVGISLDILEYDKNFNLIYLTFPKKEADYVVIKDISVINSLSLISWMEEFIMNNREFAINFFEDKAKNMTASNESIINAINYLQKEIEMVEFQIKISEVLSNFTLSAAAKNENNKDFNKSIEVTVNTTNKKNKKNPFNNRSNFRDNIIMHTVTPINHTCKPTKSENDDSISSAA